MPTPTPPRSATPATPLAAVPASPARVVEQVTIAPAITKPGVGWKSITGVAVAVLGYLLDPSVLAVLPHQIAAVISAAGVLLAGFGYRIAIAKNGAGV